VLSLADPGLTTLAGGGLVAGLVLLARGLDGYRSQIRVADTSSSTISSLAAGEVRIDGTVEGAELTLVSLLQSETCVYYKSTIRPGDTPATEAGSTDERSVGFQVRDATGTIRVFPRGARFDAPVRFEGETGLAGDEPPGLELRFGPSTRGAPTDGAMAAQALVEFDEPAGWSLHGGPGGPATHHAYQERRLTPGDPVTIIGRALPFGDLPDPTSADIGYGSDPEFDDPEIAADLEAARASGTLADDPAAAWGNAAIPGFGIGRPVTAPTLDPGAKPMALAGPTEAARAERTFSIAPETLVLAASDEVPLLIDYGLPGDIVRRTQGRFLVGLLGGILAIASAMALALSLGEGVAG
jgi:hypothetical protein